MTENIKNIPQKISKQDHIKLISQGAYGCVYKNTDEIQNNIKYKVKPQEEYIIKIQKKEYT
jgi:hypothetical protein